MEFLAKFSKTRKSICIQKLGTEEGTCTFFLFPTMSHQSELRLSIQTNSHFLTRQHIQRPKQNQCNCSGGSL